MLLSIIIPTLNEEKYLPRLLASLRQQTFSDYEIIVSDGGSSDQTQSLAQEAGCHLIVDGAIKHPSCQRNAGAKIAQGDILLFFDADTVLSPNFLEDTLAEFKNRGLIGAGFYIKFNPDNFSYKIMAFFFNSFCWCRQYLAPVAVGSGLIARREAHNKINGFDESLFVAEDFDYCFRLSKIGRWRMVKTQKLLHSSRRLERDGKFIVLFKWLKMGIFTLLNLKIKKQIVKYDFGKY